MRQHRVNVLHLLPERKHARAHAAHDEVQQVEHLLRGPAVLGDAQLDAHNLDLRSAHARGVGGARRPGARRTPRITPASCRRPAPAAQPRPPPSAHQRHYGDQSVGHRQAIERPHLPGLAGIYFLPPARQQHPASWGLPGRARQQPGPGGGSRGGPLTSQAGPPLLSAQARPAPAWLQEP